MDQKKEVRTEEMISDQCPRASCLMHCEDLAVIQTYCIVEKKLTRIVKTLASKLDS